MAWRKSETQNSIKLEDDRGNEIIATKRTDMTGYGRMANVWQIFLNRKPVGAVGNKEDAEQAIQDVKRNIELSGYEIKNERGE